MTQLAQELMTPLEAARWFRRSPSWLRQQADLLRLGSRHGQPLYHIRVCRAFVLGRLCGLDPHSLRQAQLKALASACGLDACPQWLGMPPLPENRERETAAVLERERTSA